MLYIHETTLGSLTAFAARKPHALLLTGPSGVGLKTLAIHTAQQWGKVLEVIEPVKKTKTSLPAISAETVRDLYERTRMKVSSSHVVVIDDVDTMTPTAQNAFLKLLEEPASNIHFILTSHQPDNLLATVRSRLQTLPVQPIGQASSVRLLRQLSLTDETAKNQALFIARGLPAELSRLATNKEYLVNTADTMRLARDFVTGSTYARLVTCQKVATNREAALAFIDAALLLLKISVQSSGDMRSLQLIDTLIDAKQRIRANGNIRVQLAAALL